MNPTRREALTITGAALATAALASADGGPAKAAEEKRFKKAVKI